jgi:hypothetical protein
MVKEGNSLMNGWINGKKDGYIIEYKMVGRKR